ncbi:MAG TPA: O-antigen ligase family protein [Candidatus Dormibacteraeota bacterium]|nr:O-antigen ligase family protein [Candidatus Dormibacteraeota bacterium]
MTADRPGSRSLANPPAVVAKTHEQPAGLATRVAETITRFGLPAFIITLPLEFTATYLKLQLARWVLLVVGLAFAYLLMIGRRTLVIPLGTSLAVLVLYVFASLVSWAVTRAPGSTNVVVDVIAYSAMAVLVVNLVRTEEAQRDAWVAFLISGIGVALLIAFLHFTHLSIWRADPAGVRVNGTFGDPDIAARFLTLGMCAGILMFAGRKGPVQLAAAAAVTCTAFFAFTYSKSALLLYGFCAVIAGAAGAMWVGRKRALAIGAATLAVYFAALALTPNTMPRIVRGIESIVAGSQNVVHPGPLVNQPQATSDLDIVRIYLIRSGLQMFRDHPIFGVGFGGYQHALLTHYRNFLPANPPATLSHSSAITIMSEQGLVGVVLVLAFLGLLLREVIASLKRPTQWRLWILIPAVVIVPIGLYSQFEGRFIEEPYLWLALGLLYAARTQESPIRSIELKA